MLLSGHSDSAIIDPGSLVKPAGPLIKVASPSRWRRDPGIQELIEYFDRPNKNQWGLLTTKELAVIEEQIRKCATDFIYAAKNYFWITTKETGDKLFSLWESQELIFEELLRLKGKGRAQKLIILKARQLGACLDPDTRVLTADLRWIRIADVMPGQEMVAVDENIPGGRGSGRKMRTAVAVATKEVFEPAFRILMDNGEVLIATGGHRFLCRRRGGTEAIWASVGGKRERPTGLTRGPLIPGDEIRFITKPWTPSNSFEDGWFSGMLDGEGSLRAKDQAGAEACVSQVLGPVYERAYRYLSDRGYDFRVELDERKGGDSSKFGNKPVAKLVLSRMDQIFKLIGNTRPTRFLGKRWWEGKDFPGRSRGNDIAWPRVVSVEPLGPRRMIDLQTTTGTFIAEGFVSHNSTLVEALLGWNAMFFTNTNGLVVSRDRPHAAYLFGIMLHIYDQLPWWLKPMTSSLKIEDGLKFDNPDPDQRRLNPGLHSQIDVMAATQEAGIGQGRMLIGVHVSEIGDYPDHVARQMIEGDLKNAISPSVKAFAVIESTAKGAGRYFHLLWKKNIELAERADWSCIFLPWFFEKTRVIAPEEGWRPDTPEQSMRERVKDEWTRCDNPGCASWKESYAHGRTFVGEACPFCSAGILQPFELSDQQLRFIWQERINAEKDKRSIKESKQELCTTATEAFQISGHQVFSQEILDFVDRTVRKPVAMGFLDSKGVFHGVKTIIRDPNTKQDRGSKCWQEHCDVDHRFDCDGRMPLKIWEFPEPGREYVCGVDVAEGLGGNADYSVIFVNRIGVAPSPDVHVATWRSNEIDPIGFATPVNQMGRWYNDALMSIEYNKYDTCANTVRYQFQYPNLFRWKHLDSIKNPIADKYHWYTQYNTKFRLWQTAVKWLRANLWIVRDEEFASEIKTFQKEEADERSAEAAQGFHDDVAISAFIALYTSHDMDWSDEVNAVVIRNDPTQGTTGDYRMSCTKCGEQWDTDDPNAWSHPHVGCPKCRNIILRAVKQGVSNGHTTQIQWEDMSKEPVAESEIPDYYSL